MSAKFLLVKNKIKKFKKIIKVDGDKSISIRWLLLASQAIGVSRAKELGVKISFSNNNCDLQGRGINGFKYKKNITLNAGNSGTAGRLILALLLKTPYKIKIIGDKSLSRRDFSRVIEPLEKIGAKFYPLGRKKLPISIIGSN